MGIRKSVFIRINSWLIKIIKFLLCVLGVLCGHLDLLSIRLRSELALNLLKGQVLRFSIYDFQKPWWGKLPPYKLIFYLRNP
jgi:hypothetical protein